MFWRIEVKNKPQVMDPVGQGIKRDIIDLGIDTVSDVKMIQVYILEGDITKQQVELISGQLLSDRVIQEYEFGLLEDKKFRVKKKKNFFVVETAYNPGVMDPWEESTKKGIRDLNVQGVHSIKTGRRYLINGRLFAKQLSLISEKLLYNKVIQHVVEVEHLKKTLIAHKEVNYEFKKNTVDLLNLFDRKLIALSKQMQLSLTLEEMQIIQNYFKKLKRNPDHCELETLAQTWSEHCCHKTLKANIKYTDTETKKTTNFKNLLKSTIMGATKKLNKKWCISVFKDNAGIITFDKDDNICFKVETHNHPSALEPYGGAGTGIGGVIRDILGVGLGAKPIMNTDVFCFGPPKLAVSKVPRGALHPKRVMKGVVSGVRDYGNRMGIPTSNGSVIFDERYTSNPLVYCGTVGILPKEHSFKKVSSDEYIVVVGGRTGRDGIHGATFSSIELTHESETVSSGAVQIGNAITEKKVLDTLLQARDKGLYTAVTDCGAGGLSSAVGEMGEDTGARVDLEKVPLKYSGLSYEEIWISEAQERMVISVPKSKLKKLLDLFARENVEATVIGTFTNTNHLELFYEGTKVCDLDMHFLHKGVPDTVRKAIWKKPKIKKSVMPKTRNLNSSLLKVLGDLNVCSKEWIIRQYDHEVQGMSVLKPLGGVNNDGPQDAAVIKPKAGSKKGIVVSCGINSRYGDIDPYWMAVSCIEETLRQVISVGGNLNKVSLLDNFSWGNTSKPAGLGELVRACLGCKDASLAYKIPFISGKDSLNNEFTVGGKKMSIPPTLLISAMGVVENVEKVISSDAKAPGNAIYVIGTTYDEMGGSSYCAVNGLSSPDVPKVNFKNSLKIFENLSSAVNKGLVRSCHDCSDGGLAVAMAEMAFSGGLGMEVCLSGLKHAIDKKDLSSETLLFSESNSRFVVEVEPRKQKMFEQTLKGVPYSLIGQLKDERKFRVIGTNGTVVIDCPVEKLKEAWQKPLRW
ncbi:MAG: phosphoribosylformylglycinamidine synthase subunit PurL [PVC group bacterium]|nr:phosphoribosylformylglycinamidine synthase subunit PurL [PVC group bacterium]